ncbi:uncharacterized protein LOC121870901 [Homarus americanus]|uniref:uncharacterized protein LOC121870901 n=1 Tax=Homarus americanus TaxID=6706 RepID=UPI001C46B7BA|nr:uncharacterized protein LOC121870901 [Homarus americanus]
MALDQAAAAAIRLLLILGLAAKGWGLRVSGVLVPPAVVSGSSVKLTCHYEYSTDRPDPLYSVKWYRDVNQFYEYIPQRDPQVRVYKVPNIHVDEQGSSRSTVRLTGVTRATSGTFRCEVMGDKPFFETDDHAVNMTVVDVPSWGPEVKGGIQGVPQGTGGVGSTGVIDKTRVRPGDVVSARCMIGRSDPPADITWSLNSVSPPPHARVRRFLQADKHGRTVQVSELEVEVREAWLRRGALTLSCRVQVSTIYDKTVNITFIHADHPQPQGFGWFSSGSSPRASLMLLLLPITLLSSCCCEAVTRML